MGSRRAHGGGRATQRAVVQQPPKLRGKCSTRVAMRKRAYLRADQLTTSGFFGALGCDIT
eukprot:COSAG06_NODE_4483_length_4210_cov_6.595817_2_plen_60_part_00